jgi:hypothetical protein
MPDRRWVDPNLPKSKERRAPRQVGGRRDHDSFPRTEVTKRLLVILVTLVNLGTLILEALVNECIKLVT